jgi:hypothetical protein
MRLTEDGGHSSDTFLIWQVLNEAVFEGFVAKEEKDAIRSQIDTYAARSRLLMISASWTDDGGHFLG